MNVLIIERDEVTDDRRVVLEGRRAQHLLQVLKVSEGQALRIGLVGGNRGTGRVLAVGDASVTLVVDFADAPLPPTRISLLLALPRPKVMKRLWAPLASLGVERILLCNAEKVERYYFDSHVLEPAFRRERMTEGLEQSGETRMPEVSVHRRLKVLVEDKLDSLCPEGVRWIAHPGEDGAADGAALESMPTLLAVGPEGGWTPYECDLLQAHRFRPLSLGLRILRTDVACIALLSRLQAGCG